MLYAADAQWWGVHAQTALNHPGLKLTSDKLVPYRQVVKLKQTGREGYDPTPGCVRTGGNGGYQALHVAIQAGARRVLLLGYDMGGTHFFGKHTNGLRNTPDSTFAKWIPRFAVFAGLGVEVINCALDSALPWFPKMPLAEALDG